MKAIATIDLKKDEEGFLQVAAKNNWAFITYTPEQLNEMPLKTLLKKCISIQVLTVYVNQQLCAMRRRTIGC